MQPPNRTIPADSPITLVWIPPKPSGPICRCPVAQFKRKKDRSLPRPFSPVAPPFLFRFWFYLHFCFVFVCLYPVSICVLCACACVLLFILSPTNHFASIPYCLCSRLTPPNSNRCGDIKTTLGGKHTSHPYTYASLIKDMAPPSAIGMSSSSASGEHPLDDYKFTFESYVEDSGRTEPDDLASFPQPDIYNTQSLSESIANYREEFGRTYHSYRAGSYHFPNDTAENERVNDQYEIVKMVMDDHLHLCPFPPNGTLSPKILDIATGTGLWAIEMGDEHPEAEVIGTDLSPIQPGFVPPNVRFFVEDSTEPWLYPPPNPQFDLIHTRITIGCWSDMKTQILIPAFGHLKPGGYLECQEIPGMPLCDDGTMSPDYGFFRWTQELYHTAALAQRQVDVGPQLKRWMEEVGFVDVKAVTYKIPLNGWAREGKMKSVGMLWQRNLSVGLSGFTLSLFNKFLEKSVEEIEVSLVNVRKSLLDRRIHAYHKLFVVYGRKPFDNEMAGRSQ
ncbi:S-adenosyl-L-methionine-dependent methyltransferase [Cladorrhinum sp. PSN332]|nr:S-adenosyl-L-methionine-dependent methyltransferase [Cladorrhinum sp. PSN332]